jgi:hypothetical protein
MKFLEPRIAPHMLTNGGNPFCICGSYTLTLIKVQSFRFAEPSQLRSWPSVSRIWQGCGSVIFLGFGKGRHEVKFGTNINHVSDVSADTVGGGNPNNALAVQPVAYPAFLLGTMVVDALLGGWEYSAFLHIRSGTRFDVTDSDTTSLNNGQTNRPDRIGVGTVSHPTVSHWFDTTAFVVHTTPMTYGTSGIDPLHADGEQQLDSSLFKTFHPTERQALQFRVDACNTFNHPNFSAPDSGVGDAAEGQFSPPQWTTVNCNSRFAIRSKPQQGHFGLLGPNRPLHACRI